MGSVFGRRWRRRWRCFGACGMRFGLGCQPFLVLFCPPTPGRSFTPLDLLFQFLPPVRDKCLDVGHWLLGRNLFAGRHLRLLGNRFGLWLLASNLFGEAVCILACLSGLLLRSPIVQARALVPLTAAERASKFKAHASQAMAMNVGGAYVEAAERALRNGFE